MYVCVCGQESCSSLYHVPCPCWNKRPIIRTSRGPVFWSHRTNSAPCCCIRANAKCSFTSARWIGFGLGWSDKDGVVAAVADVVFLFTPFGQNGALPDVMKINSILQRSSASQPSAKVRFAIMLWARAQHGNRIWCVVALPPPVLQMHPSTINGGAMAMARRKKQQHSHKVIFQPRIA